MEIVETNRMNTEPADVHLAKLQAVVDITCSLWLTRETNQAMRWFSRDGLVRNQRADSFGLREDGGELICVS